jgi:hypothetical protein
MTRRGGAAILLLIGLMALGCGTTRQTDTTRSATEMLLLSQAIDNSVNRLDFTPLKGKTVFFEEKCLDGVTDKGYLASSIRCKLLGDGCILVEEKAKANYVVEARAGCVGTDKHSLLLGVPQMNLPTILPGQPPMIPEIPLVKRTDQEGVAKIAVFAYNRLTGKAVWQSGVQESVSTSKDVWVFGTGPFRQGSVKKETDSAMAQLDVLGVFDKNGPNGPANGTIGVTQAAYFTEADKPEPGQGVQQLGHKEQKPAPSAAPSSPAPAPAPAPFPPPPPGAVGGK